MAKTNEESLRQMERTMKVLRRIFQFRTELESYFSDLQIKLFQETIQAMYKDLLALSQNKKVITTGEMKSKVKECLNHLKRNFPSSLTPIYKDLTYFFTLLSYNWNKQVGFRPDIEQVIVELRKKLPPTTKKVSPSIECRIRRIEQELTKIEERLKLLNQYNPPVFKLSEHYLKILSEELKKKESE